MLPGHKLHTQGVYVLGKRGLKHRQKILAGVFHRRHILATYDTYE